MSDEEEIRLALKLLMGDYYSSEVNELLDNLKISYTNDADIGLREKKLTDWAVDLLTPLLLAAKNYKWRFYSE